MEINKIFLPILLLFILAVPVFSQKDKLNKIILYAQKQEYDVENDILTATGNISIKSKDLSLYAQNAKYIGKEQKLELQGKVKITDKENNLLAEKVVFSLKENGGMAYNNVHYESKNISLNSQSLQFNFKEKIFIAENKVLGNFTDEEKNSTKILTEKLNFNSKNNILVAQGNSKIMREDLQIQGEEITLNNNTKEMAIEGKAFLKNEKEENFILQGKKIQFYFKEKGKEIIKSQGSVKITKGDTSASADFLEYNKQQDLATLKGNAQATSKGNSISGETIKLSFKNKSISSEKSRIIVFPEEKKD